MVKEDPLQEFISSRQRPETQADAALLISILAGARQQGDGWIRTNELQRALIDTGRFKSQKTLFRFLKELEDRDLIEKEPRIEHTSRSHSDKKKENIYYRLKVVPEYQAPLEIPIMDRIARRYAELAAAKELLKPYYDDPDAAIDQKVKEMFRVTIEPDTEDETRTPTPATAPPQIGPLPVQQVRYIADGAKAHFARRGLVPNERKTEMKKRIKKST